MTLMLVAIAGAWLALALAAFVPRRPSPRAAALAAPIVITPKDRTDAN